MQGDITAEISEATHSIRTVTVDIQIESDQTTGFFRDRPEGGRGGSSLMKMKDYKEMTESKPGWGVGVK